jgi:hypothetical protein
MVPARGRELLLDGLWVVALALASSVWCVTSAARLGPTADEPVYVQGGLERWRTGNCRALTDLGTMPLPVEAQTLPLYLAERWRGVPFDAAADLDRLLPWARAANLLFWWLLLLYGRAAGRHLAGPWGGRLAVALIALEPNLLAHASLATTDIAYAACLLALVVEFLKGRDRRWPRRLAVPAFWFGAGLLAKTTGVVFGPLCLALVSLDPICRRLRGEAPASGSGLQPWAGLWPLARDLLIIGAAGLALAFVWCGSSGRIPSPLAVWLQQQPLPGRLGQALTALSIRLDACDNGFNGIWLQLRRSLFDRPTGAYLLGRWYPNNIWCYYPVALSIKLPVPLLLAPLTLALVRPRALANGACAAAAGLLLFSLTCRIQIGVRYLFPLVVLASVGLAGAAVTAAATAPRRWQRRLLVHATLLALLWMAADALAVWPNALCYTNELWGGSARGYRRLSDSNYDWGQGRKELTRWQQRRAAAPLEVWCIGRDPLWNAVPGMHRIELDGLPVEGPSGIVSRLHGHYLAVGATCLYGYASDSPAGVLLRSVRPIARTSTFFIYDFTQGLPASPIAGQRWQGGR